MLPTLHLLQHVHACGERLREALGEGNFEAVPALLEDRAAWIEKLRDTPRPDPQPTEWTDASNALADQYQQLLGLLNEYERKTNEALAATTRHRQARTSYGEKAPRSPILNPIRG